MFKMGETLTLLSDSFGSKRGDKVIYLWNTIDSGFEVALCVIVDEHYKVFMKNNECYCINQVVKELDKFNNRNSLEMRLNCIKPYPEQLINRKILEKRKDEIQEELAKIDRTLELLKD